MEHHRIHPIARIFSMFASLEPSTLGRLDDYYLETVTFRDPINEGEGLADLQLIFADLFKQLDNIRMDITHAEGDRESAFLKWSMYYEFRGKARELPGVTYLTFSRDGRVASQRDYWDAAKGVFEEFPLIGTGIRLARRGVRVRTSVLNK